MAETPFAEKRHQEDRQSEDFRDDEDGKELAVAGEKLRELVQAAEGPFGPGGGVGFGRIGGGAEFHPRPIAGNSMLQRQCRDDDENGQASEGVPGGLARPVGDAASFIRRSLGRPPSAARREPGVQGERRQQGGRQHAGVQGEKARRREVSERRPADRQLVHLSANSRQQQEEAGSHLGAPVAVLVPGEEVAGEVQGQRQHAGEHDGPEEKFPRRPIGPAEDRLHQVNADQHEHDLGGVVMHRPQQPSAEHLRLNVVDAFPGGLGGGAVVHPEDDAADELREEKEGDRRRPDVPPRRPAGDGAIQPASNRGTKAGAVLDPRQQCIHD